MINILKLEFELTRLLDSILDPEVSINEVASDWLESYSENPDVAIQDLVNFILKVSKQRNYN